MPQTDMSADLLWETLSKLECQDNSCVFDGKGKGGMRTNGGCRCLSDIHPSSLRIAIQRFYFSYKKELAQRDRDTLTKAAERVCDDCTDCTVEELEEVKPTCRKLRAVLAPIAEGGKHGG